MHFFPFSFFFVTFRVLTPFKRQFPLDFRGLPISLCILSKFWGPSRNGGLGRRRRRSAKKRTPEKLSAATFSRSKTFDDRVFVCCFFLCSSGFLPQLIHSNIILACFESGKAKKVNVAAAAAVCPFVLFYKLSLFLF